MIRIDMMELCNDSSIARTQQLRPGELFKDEPSRLLAIFTSTGAIYLSLYLMMVMAETMESRRQ